MLKQYKAKRSFTETPEPKGTIKSSKGLPIFVVQKHDATRLHYDFRLEHDGVLLSWAVPKGPSLNPNDKRLAIQVEDHPFDYRDFEGIIPKGNYGAGTVMVWDEGTYTVPGAETKKEIAKAVSAGLAKGHLEVTLHGDKLNGTFHLVRTKGDEDKPQWLLFHSKDDFATQKDVTKLDHSVKTGRSLDEIGGKEIKTKKKARVKSSQDS
jgi:bifunctional non-homologous end joining protein LigD